MLSQASSDQFSSRSAQQMSSESAPHWLRISIRSAADQQQVSYRSTPNHSRLAPAQLQVNCWWVIALDQLQIGYRSITNQPHLKHQSTYNNSAVGGFSKYCVYKLDYVTLKNLFKSLKKTSPQCSTLFLETKVWKNLGLHFVEVRVFKCAGIWSFC